MSLSYSTLSNVDVQNFLWIWRRFDFWVLGPNKLG